MIIALRAARPQPHPAPNSLLTAHRRGWAMWLASRESRQAELAAAAAADAEREQEIEAARQRLIYARIRAELVMASNAMKLLIKARTSEQVRRLEIQRGLAQ